jgi:aromatic ring-cleaving dioxygenase
MQQPTDAATIREYHAHVYYGPDSRGQAAKLREWVRERFDARIGDWRDLPVGPHMAAQYSVAFDAQHFHPLVSFLMMNRKGVTVMVHPQSGHSFDDHTQNAIWMGDTLPINTDFLIAFTEGQSNA